MRVQKGINKYNATNFCQFHGVLNLGYRANVCFFRSIIIYVLLTCLHFNSIGQRDLPKHIICNNQLKLEELKPTEADSILFCFLKDKLSNLKEADYKGTISLVKEAYKIRYDSSAYFPCIDFATYGYDLAQKMRDTLDQFYFMDQLAFIHNRIGNYLESNEIILKGDRLSKEKKDTKYQAQFLYRKAILVRRSLDQYDWSQDLLREYYRLNDFGINDLEVKYYYYNGLATAFAKKNNYLNAQIYGDSALMVAREISDPKILALALSWRSWYYPIGTNEEIEYRLQLISEALAINHVMNDKEQLAANYGLKAMHYYRNSEFDKALKTYQLCKIYTFQIDDKVRHNSYYLGMSYVLDAMGRDDLAYENLKNAYGLYKEIFGPSTISKLLRYQNKIEKKETERKIKQLDFEKKLLDLKLEQQKNNVLLITLSFLLLSLIGLFYFSRTKQKEKIKKLQLQKESQEVIAELERKALKAQMNPHFLFNCLNSIKSYIANNEPRQATNYLNKFAALIRMILNHSDKKLIPILDELKAMELYIELENLRMNHEMKYEVRIHEKENLRLISIPPMIIQPFIENAIIHGLNPKKEDKQLLLDCKRNGDQVVIRIRDNGVGRKTELEYKKTDTSKHKSYGLKITSERLKKLQKLSEEELNFEIIDLVSTNGEALGTEVIIYLPVNLVE